MYGSLNVEYKLDGVRHEQKVRSYIADDHTYRFERLCNDEQ